MDKFFNAAGPNMPDVHYTLSPMQRVNWLELSGLIAVQKYFILHAPRQTGYADQCGSESAHLLIINRDSTTPWDDKIYREEHRYGERAISV